MSYAITELPAYPPARDSFGLGEAVWVHAMGSWYPAVVSGIGRTNVEVKYQSGAGHWRTKTVNPTKAVSGNLRPGTTRGGGERVRTPLVLRPEDYRSLLKDRPLRDSETWPTCECGAPRDPHTGRLACVR